MSTRTSSKRTRTVGRNRGRWPADTQGCQPPRPSALFRLLDVADLACQPSNVTRERGVRLGQDNRATICCRGKHGVVVADTPPDWLVDDAAHLCLVDIGL